MVIDTNIFIEHLRSKNKSGTALYNISDNSELFVTAISLYELYMGAVTPEKKHDIQTLTEDLIILPFDQSVAIKAAEVYHQLKSDNKLIEFRDIFIAATCLVNNLPIATLNKSHFNRIKGLTVI